MGMYPQVQRKAQEELDFVVGPDRLPTFEDKGSLPYIEAIILECLRWMPVLPLGVPHRVLIEDEYRGYRIPKGTIIMAVSTTSESNDSHCSFPRFSGCMVSGILSL